MAITRQHHVCYSDIFRGPLIELASIALALYRGLMISLGIVAAVAMNNLVFPRHCRVRASSCVSTYISNKATQVLLLRNACRSLRVTGALYMSMIRCVLC